MTLFTLPWSYSTGEWIFNVRKADVSRWPLKYSKNENKTQHPYFSKPLLTVCMYVCIPAVRKPHSGRRPKMCTCIQTDAGTQYASLWTAVPYLLRQHGASGPTGPLQRNQPYCDLQLEQMSSDRGWVTVEEGDENVLEAESAVLRNVRLSAGLRHHGVLIHPF